MLKLKKRFNKLLSSEKEDGFKLINIRGEPEHKNVLITYQVCGKATSVDEAPGKLVDDLMFLKGFTKEDSEIIYGLAVKERESPSYKVFSILFDEDGSCLCVKDVKLDICFKIRTSDIFEHDSAFLDKIDSTTLQSVLALYYSEYFQAQSNILKQNKKNYAENSYLRIIK